MSCDMVKGSSVRAGIYYSHRSFSSGTIYVCALLGFSQYESIHQFFKWDSMDCADMLFYCLLRPTYSEQQQHAAFASFAVITHKAIWVILLRKWCNFAICLFSSSWPARLTFKYTGLIRLYFRRYAKKEPLQGKQHITEENCVCISSLLSQKFFLYQHGLTSNLQAFQKNSTHTVFTKSFPTFWFLILINNAKKPHSIMNIPLIAWIVLSVPWFLHFQNRLQTAPLHPIAYKEIKI